MALGAGPTPPLVPPRVRRVRTQAAFRLCGGAQRPLLPH